MEAVRFREFLICNSESNKTIEEHVRFLFSYAGIHDFSFDDTLRDAFASLSPTVWNTGSASDFATWEIAAGQLKGTGGADGDWDHLLSVDDMPSEGVLTIYKSSTRGGLVFRATDKDNHYLFYWDSNSVGFAKCSSGTYTTLVDIPKIYTGEGDITLSWRETKFSSADDHKWLFMSAWIDGELAIAWQDDITLATPGKKIGFAVYDSDVIYFDNLRIPELTEVIDWCSMDVGESPAGALSRLIGRRHVNYFLRYNGTLRMWRPKSTASTWTYQRHITGFNWHIDSRELASHWRQIGAWEQADRFDTILLQVGIGRFHKDNNPDLLTKEACYNEAGYSIQKIRQDSDRIDMSAPLQVLQEPEDVVTVYFVRDGHTVINNDLYIVDIGQGFTASFNGQKLEAMLHLRKKV